MLSRILFAYDRKILYFFDDMEKVKDRLHDVEIEVLDEIEPAFEGDDWRIFRNLSYKAIRRFLRYNGFISGKLGKRARYLMNLSLEKESFRSMGRFPYLGYLHRGIEFYLDCVHDEVYLFLSPRIRLLFPLLNILTHNLVEIHSMPSCYVAKCNEPCTDRCALPRLFLAPSEEEGRYFEVLSDSESCPKFEDVELFVNSLRIPKNALHLLPSSSQMRVLRLSNPFLEFQSKRYAFRVRNELAHFLNRMEENNEIIIPFDSDESLIFDGSLVRLRG